MPPLETLDRMNDWNKTANVAFRETAQGGQVRGDEGRGDEDGKD